MEKIEIKEMTAGDDLPEIIEADWRRMPHRFDTGSRVERLALWMLLGEVAKYAGYLVDFAYGYYGDEVAEGLANFYALVHREFHKRAEAEGVRPELIDDLEALEWLCLQDSLTSREAEEAMNRAVKLGRELPVDPVEVVTFDPVDAWFEAATDDDE